MSVARDNAVTGWVSFFHWNFGLKGVSMYLQKHKWKESKGKRGKGEIIPFLARKKENSILEWR